MNKLEEARLIINEADHELIESFKKRMNAAKMIASYKKENNLPIYDEEKEKDLINKNIILLDSEELEKYYLTFLEGILKASKDYQKDLMNK